MSSSPLISRLNTATARFFWSAACSAMPRARAVLPMLGRAATTTMFPAWSPPMTLSRSMNPVGTPTTPPPDSSAAVSRSRPLITSLSARVKSPRTPLPDRS